MAMYGILLPCLGWCPYLLIGIIRQATKTNMQDCWSFTCYFTWTLGSSSKCGQLKSFVLLRQMFFRTGSSGSTFFSRGRSTRYYDRLHDFSVAIPRCHKDVFVNSFFPRRARLWNFLPIDCFPLTYDFNGFKSRIKRHLLTVGSF